MVAITAALAGSVLSIALGFAGRRRSAAARRQDDKLFALSCSTRATKLQTEDPHEAWAIQVFKPWSLNTPVRSTLVASEKVKAHYPAGRAYKPIKEGGDECGQPTLFGNDVYDVVHDTDLPESAALGLPLGSGGTACVRDNAAYEEAWARADVCGPREAPANKPAAAEAPTAPATPLSTSPSLLRMDSWATMSDLEVPLQLYGKPGSYLDGDSSESELDEESYTLLGEDDATATVTLGNPLFSAAAACADTAPGARRCLLFAGAVDNPFFALYQGSGERGGEQGARAEAPQAAASWVAPVAPDPGCLLPAGRASLDLAGDQQLQVAPGPAAAMALASSPVPVAGAAEAHIPLGRPGAAGRAAARAGATQGAAVSRAVRPEAVRPPFRPASKYTPPPPPRLPAPAAKRAAARPVEAAVEGGSNSSSLPSYMRPTQAFLASTVGAAGRRAPEGSDHGESTTRQCAAAKPLVVKQRWR